MVKVILIFLFFFLFMIGFNVLLDFFVHIPFQTSLANSINPFWVMEAGELAVFLILLFICIAIPLKFYFKQRLEEKN
ncbi:MAG: hypothetical protein LPK00_09715 [Bacillaceae bacterium]|nr:hypothetical protein [Bacillaceae bacterium]